MVIPAMEGRTWAVQETIGRLCPRPSIQSLSVGLQTVRSVTALVPVLCGEQFTCLNLGFWDTVVSLGGVHRVEFLFLRLEQGMKLQALWKQHFHSCSVVCKHFFGFFLTSSQLMKFDAILPSCTHDNICPESVLELKWSGRMTYFYYRTGNQHVFFKFCSRCIMSSKGLDTKFHLIFLRLLL